MKIAVSGAHSTGKTSFLKEVYRRLKTSGFLCGLVTGIAGRCPLPILRQHTVESTLWIVTTSIAEEVATAYGHSIVLVDRPILDAWAYFLASDRYNPDLHSSNHYMTLEATISNWMPTYALIYKTEIDTDTPIRDTKGRDQESSS